MSKLLVPREVDQMLRFPHGRAIKLERRGELPAVFLPDGEIRFDSEAIQAWIRDRTQPPKVDGVSP